MTLCTIHRPQPPAGCIGNFLFCVVLRLRLSAMLLVAFIDYCSIHFR